MTDINIKQIFNNANDVSNSNKTESTKENEEYSIFQEEEKNTNIVELALDTILGNGSFTLDEAQIYVDGETEVDELIKEAQKDMGLLEIIFDFGATEKEIREDYEEKHPEYAKVKDEGDKVQKEYDEAYEEARNNWLEENPKPEKIFSLEYLSWSLKQTNAMNEFKNKYAKENPDFANLLAAQNKNKSILELILGS